MKRRSMDGDKSHAFAQKKNLIPDRRDFLIISIIDPPLVDTRYVPKNNLQL